MFITINERSISLSGLARIKYIAGADNPISRLYYFLEFTSRSRFTIFHGLITGRWCRQNWV
jgi:hypothetical protein